MSKSLFALATIASATSLSGKFLISAIFKSIDQHSWEPMIHDVGEKLVISTKVLADDSQKIIDEQISKGYRIVQTVQLGGAEIILVFER